MGTFVVDTSQVQANLGSFPPVPVEAKVLSVKSDVSKKGGSMLVLELGIYHPDVGEATIKDWLPSSFPAKVKAFWMAINDLTEADMASAPVVEINPPDLIGAQLIVVLGREEGKDPNTGQPNGKVYTKIVSPWYHPISRVELLPVPADAPL